MNLAVAFCVLLYENNVETTDKRFAPDCLQTVYFYVKLVNVIVKRENTNNQTD